MTAESDATALVHRNLIGVLLGVALLFVGVVLWLFLGRWGKRTRAAARQVFRCNRRRRKCAGLPAVEWEKKCVDGSAQGAEPVDAKLPVDDAEKGVLKLGDMKTVRFGKDSFPTLGPHVISAHISVAKPRS